MTIFKLVFNRIHLMILCLRNTKQIIREATLILTLTLIQNKEIVSLNLVTDIFLKKCGSWRGN